jgi:hypothetical protein
VSSLLSARSLARKGIEVVVIVAATIRRFRSTV